MEPKKELKSIQSIERAINILESFGNEKQQYGVTELSKKLGLQKSTVHGILATLSKRGYVEPVGSSGNYRLGLKLFEMGTLVQQGMDLKRIAEPFLQELLDRHGETVHLVTMDQGEVVYIDKKESYQSMRIVSQVGKRLPCHCTGVGKSILAFLPEEEWRSIIETMGMQKYTNQTIVDIETLEKELLKIKNQYFAIDNEEITEGLRCVAAPVKDFKHKVIGAISVAGPNFRMTDEKMTEVAKSVTEAARDISIRLGCSHYFAS